MGFEYRYLTDDGQPATTCPECGQDWTKDGGVEINLSIGDQHAVVPSRLTRNGNLEDTEDNGVFNGYHAGTVCVGCGDYLSDLVDEVQAKS